VSIIRTAPENFNNWRTVEVAVVDALRRQGCRLHYYGGVTYVICEFHDDNTGELLHRRRVLSVADFARDLIGALP
jgi:hypothetical protein